MSTLRLAVTDESTTCPSHFAWFTGTLMFAASGVANFSSASSSSSSITFFLIAELPAHSLLFITPAYVATCVCLRKLFLAWIRAPGKRKKWRVDFGGGKDYKCGIFGARAILQRIGPAGWRKAW